MDDIDKGWLAGILEGEGCFTTTGSNKSTGRKYVGIYLMSCDRDVVERGARLMGTKCSPVKTTSAWSKKPQFRATLHGAKACALMRELLPLMGERRSERINELLASQEG